MNSSRKRLKKQVEYIEVAPATDLPPLVEGELRCFLLVTIGKLVWSSTSSAQRAPLSPAYIKLRWWGEASDGTYFRAQSDQSDRIIKTRSQFGIRSGPKQMAAYLNDMGVFTFEILASPNSVPLGRIQIPNAISLTSRNPIRGHFPIFSASSRKLGELYISLSIKDLKNAYNDTSESDYTSFDVSINRSHSRKGRRSRRGNSSARSRSSSNGERSQSGRKRSTSRSSGGERSTSLPKTRSKKGISESFLKEKSTNSRGNRSRSIDTPRGIDDQLEKNGHNLYLGTEKMAIPSNQVAIQTTTSVTKPTNSVSNNVINKPLQDLLNQGKKLRDEINKITLTSEVAKPQPPSIIYIKPKVTLHTNPAKEYEVPCQKFSEEEVKCVPRKFPVNPTRYNNTEMNVCDMVLSAKGLNSDYRPDLSRMSSVFSDMEDPLHDEEILRQLFYNHTSSSPSYLQPAQIQNQKLSTDEKLKQLLHVSHAHVTVKNLQIISECENKNSPKKQLSKKQKVTKRKPEIGVYYVKYQLPSSTNFHISQEPVLTTSNKLISGCISFDQDSNIPIQFNNVIEAREWISECLEFYVFKKKQNEKGTTCIGVALVPLSSFLLSKTFKFDEGIKIFEIKDKYQTSKEIGNLQVSVELVQSQKRELPTMKNELKYSEPKPDQQTKLADANRQASNVTDPASPESRVEIHQFKSAQTKENIETDLLYLYFSIEDAKNIPETRILSGKNVVKVCQPNVYLVCKTIALNKTSKTQICWGTSNPKFHFDQVTPVKISSEVFARLQNNFMVIEVWVKTCSNNKETDDDKLMGIVKVPLQPFYQSLKNDEIAREVLSTHYPLISVDGYLPIMDVFTGSERGELSVLLALGSNTQVATLKRIRTEELQSKRPVVKDPISYQNTESLSKTVQIQLEVIRISGLKTAAKLLASNSDNMDLTYCSEVGVNAYAVIKTQLIGDKKVEQSNCVARSFHPNLNHLFTVDISNSTEMPLAQAICDGFIEIQIWHKPIDDDNESKDDILLGSSQIPTYHLLTKATGYTGWVICSLETDRGQIFTNVCSAEVSLSFKSQQDLHHVIKSSQLLGWSPSPDLERIVSLNNLNTNNGIDKTHDHVTTGVTITSALLMKNNLIRSSETEVSSRAHVYFRYKFFEHGSVTSSLCPVIPYKGKRFNRNGKPISVKVAHMRSFLCKLSSSLLMYLQEEIFKIEVWLTFCKGNRSAKRPMESDIFLGEAQIDMNPVYISGLSKQQHISGAFTTFKGGQDWLNDSSIRVYLSFIPGNSNDLIGLGHFDKMHENVSTSVESFSHTGHDSTDSDNPENGKKLSELNEKDSIVSNVVANDGKLPECDDFFTAMLTVEKAMHLPQLITKTRNDENSSVVSNTQGCYVSYSSFESKGEIICSDVVKLSQSPVWNNTTKIKIDKSILSRGDSITFTVWQCNYNSTPTEPNAEKLASDQMIGFANVDIAMLRVGFHTINGWYNILDIQGCCQGQLKVVITPTDPAIIINTPLSPPLKVTPTSTSSKPRNLNFVPLLGPVHTPSGSMYMPGTNNLNNHISIQTSHTLTPEVDPKESILVKLQQQIRELEGIKQKFQQKQTNNVLSSNIPSSEIHSIPKNFNDNQIKKNSHQEGIPSFTPTINNKQNTSDVKKTVHLSLFKPTSYADEENQIQSDNECSEIEFVCPKSLNEEIQANSLSGVSFKTQSEENISDLDNTTFTISNSSSLLNIENNTVCNNPEKPDLINKTLLDPVKNIELFKNKVDEISPELSPETEQLPNHVNEADCDLLFQNSEAENISLRNENSVEVNDIPLDEPTVYDTRSVTNTSNHDSFSSVLTNESLKSIICDDQTELKSPLSDPASSDDDQPTLFTENTTLLPSGISSNPKVLPVKKLQLPNSMTQNKTTSQSHQTELPTIEDTSGDYRNTSLISSSESDSSMLSTKQPDSPTKQSHLSDESSNKKKTSPKASISHRLPCFFPPNKDLVGTMKAIEIMNTNQQQIDLDNTNENKSSKTEISKRSRRKLPPSLHLDAEQTKRLARIFITKYTAG